MLLLQQQQQQHTTRARNCSAATRHSDLAALANPTTLIMILRFDVPDIVVAPSQDRIPSPAAMGFGRGCPRPLPSAPRECGRCRNFRQWGIWKESKWWLAQEGDPGWDPHVVAYIQWHYLCCRICETECLSHRWCQVSTGDEVVTLKPIL